VPGSHIPLDLGVPDGVVSLMPRTTTEGEQYGDH
jgi:hypothetical protein